MDSYIGSEVSCWKKRQPTGDVLLIERKALPCEQHQRIQDGAPGDLLPVDGIKEMPRAREILCEQKRPVSWTPDREGPVSEELRQAVRSPFLVRSRNGLGIRRSGRWNAAKFPEQFGPVVEPPVPGEDGS